jgi:hypothetical protein
MHPNEWDELATVLGDVDFPANRQDIINHARQRQATSAAVELLRDLPVGIYRNLVDVRVRALGDLEHT